MMSNYAAPFEPQKFKTLDTHLETLFYHEMALEYEEDPGVEGFLPDVIAKIVMGRVLYSLEDRLSGEKMIRDYETWLENQGS